MKTDLKSFDISKILIKLLIVIGIGISANMIFSLYTSDKTVLKSLMNFSVDYFLLAVLLTIIPWFTHTLRLQIWSNFLDNPLSFKDGMKIAIGTDLGSAISSPTVGSTGVKIAMLIQKGFNPATSTSISILGNLESDLFAFVTVPIALSIASSWDLPVIKVLLDKMSHLGTVLVWVSLFTGFIITALVILKKKFNIVIFKKSIKDFKWLSKIIQYLKNYWADFKGVYYLIGDKGKSLFLLSFILTGIQLICRYSIFSALLYSIGIKANIFQCYALQWCVFTLMSFTPTPGASGGAEAAFYFIFKSFFNDKTIGLVTLGWRFLTFYFLLLLGTVIFILLNTPTGFFAKLLKRPLIPEVRMSIDETRI
jgi:glycosyltransferase 2 family protein